MATETPVRPTGHATRERSPLQRLAVALAGAVAVLYGLLFAGVLTLEGATDGERGILGVAAAVFAVLAGLLWWRASRLLWGIGAALQLLLGWMYLAIAPDRDPSYEVWGLTIRGVSLALLVVLVALLVRARGRQATES